MDVAATLQARPEVADSDSALRELYSGLGVTLTNRVVAQARTSLTDRRFDYAPPAGGFEITMARIYVARRRWLPGALAVVLALVIGLGGYFLVYLPYVQSAAATAERELTETIPAQLDSLYGAVFEETKVQSAAQQAATIRDAGKAAAEKGDRLAARRAVDDLTALRDQIRRDYRLVVADRPGVKWGFWTFPDNNSDETYYYLVVDARAADGSLVPVPVKAGDTSRIEMVSTYAVRVVERVYRAVEADKGDNGRIDRALVALKQYGYVDPDFAIDVSGGTLTRW